MASSVGHMPRGRSTLSFHDDPRAFLAAAGEHLGADPVLSTVVASVTAGAAREDAEGVEPALPHRWWVVAHDERGEISGVGMRTAPFAPYPVFLLPMPGEAAAALAQVLHARRERVCGVNGALPAAQVCAGELARLQGGTAEVSVHTRLHEATRMVDPAPSPGRLRLVREDEVGLALQWFAAFAIDADEQAGRPPGSLHSMTETEDGLRRRIAQERVWFWADEDDTPVHVTGHSEATFGATRIGPVFTPREHRGRGYAGNGVAQVSRRILETGSRPCLYTDQANPTSNPLYAALGFVPVVDMVDMVIG